MSDELEMPAPMTPAEQRSIDFYGEELVAVQDAEGTVWLPMRPLCDVLGVVWSSQRDRISRDAVMGEVVRAIRVVRPGERGGAQEMACLPLDVARFWLIGINANRVKPEFRDRLVEYQREAIEIIEGAFARVPAAPAGVDDAHIITMRDLAARQAQSWDLILIEKRRLEDGPEDEETRREIEESIARLRRELAQLQAEMHRRLVAVSDGIQLAPLPEPAPAAQSVESSLLALLGGAEPAPSADSAEAAPAQTEPRITPEQNSAIRGLVETLVAAAEAKGVRLWRGRNNYQATYRTFNRAFGVGRSEELTQSQYPKAVDWLKREIEKVEGRAARKR
ncbi:MAG TPA: phage antirepressor N-terminal domain-containing protein [Ardenticatenaceae bacterium]|nr:phage antirepressor N-terminal domain-containing protein [Ardenticatenaceae bacterium]